MAREPLEQAGLVLDGVFLPIYLSDIGHGFISGDQGQHSSGARCGSS